MVPSASSIIAASRPAPAITAKCSPFIAPTSSGRSAPRIPIWTARSRSRGIPRFVASRLAVPAGTIASVVERPHEGVDHALDAPVAAPHEDQVGAAVDELPDPLRHLAALVDLFPQRVVRRPRPPAPSAARRARRRATSPCAPPRRRTSSVRRLARHIVADIGAGRCVARSRRHDGGADRQEREEHAAERAAPGSRPGPSDGASPARSARPPPTRPARPRGPSRARGPRGRSSWRRRSARGCRTGPPRRRCAPTGSCRSAAPRRADRCRAVAGRSSCSP